MKYSLRSLMTFSIRDLFWLTLVAAILAAWLVNHRLQRGLMKQAEQMRQDAEKQRVMADGRFLQAKYYLQSKGYVVAESGESRVAFADPRSKGMPIPSAPAPNPPTP